MLPETVSRTLTNPSAREIRDTKLTMWADWEATYNMPANVTVRRGYDLMLGCRFATIIVRSAIPATMKWNG